MSQRSTLLTPVRALLVLVVVMILQFPATQPSTAQQDTGAVRFAAVGDFGCGNGYEGAVAEMVQAWEPDFIITTGDNNYVDGSGDTIDEHIGQFYHAYIHPYRGDYGDGADINRFFPILGNHDMHTKDGKPYLDYFILPGNERYYEFVWGPVHFFALNSNDSEPDGITADSAQAEWLKTQLNASEQPWNIITMHHPPFSSGPNGPKEDVRWPFAEWGATVALFGHEHYYERIMAEDGFPYIINGAGGCGLYDFNDKLTKGSEVQYNDDYGAMLVTATPDSITFEFYSIADGGTLIDSFTLDLP